MQRHFAIAVILLIAAFTLFFLAGPPRPAPPVAARELDGPRDGTAADSSRIGPSSAVAKASPPGESTSPEADSHPIGPTPVSLASRASALPPDADPSTNLPPEIVLRNVQAAMRQYAQAFGGNPVGTNPEITSQLSGNNPKHINFIDPGAGLRVNGAGALIDPWGTPFFFHQLSSTDMEIHSAGPDKTMWTYDDLVSK